MIGVELTYTDAGNDDKTNGLFVSIKGIGISNTSHSRSDVLAVAPDELDVTKDVFKGGVLTGNTVLQISSSDVDGLVLYASAGFSNDGIYFATT